MKDDEWYMLKMSKEESIIEKALVDLGPTKRVLSIQSHVVHGYAGNKCAVFPLQVRL